MSQNAWWQSIPETMIRFPWIISHEWFGLFLYWLVLSYLVLHGFRPVSFNNFLYGPVNGHWKVIWIPLLSLLLNWNTTKKSIKFLFEPKSLWAINPLQLIQVIRSLQSSVPFGKLSRIESYQKILNEQISSRLGTMKTIWKHLCWFSTKRK